MAIKQLLLTALGTALLLGGCAKNDDASHEKAIRFDASRVGKYARVADYIESGFSVGDQIGVLGYALPTGAWTGTETPALMYNSELVKITEKTYRYNPMVPWPSLGKAQFFAYYPYNGSVTEGIISLPPVMQNGYPSATVVLGKSGEPIDFMTAQVDATDYTTSQGVVKFAFDHRLSKLKFKAKAPNLPTDTRLFIGTIRLRNIYNKAVYYFDADRKGRWGDYSNESTSDAVSGATLRFDSATQAVGKDDYTDLLTAYKTEAYVLMLPQTYSNTEIEIDYTLEYLNSNGGCEYRVMGSKTYPVSVDWKMGAVYTYYFEFALAEVEGIDVKVSVVRDQNDSEWGNVDVDTEID